MKWLWCLLAFTMPCSSFAAGVFAAEAQQAQTDGGQGAEVRHHPLIEVKYVLRFAPPEQDKGLPSIEFGENHSVVKPMLLSGSRVMSLNPADLGPNVFVCSGWGCRDAGEAGASR
jgi:hypothetical protein